MIRFVQIIEILLLAPKTNMGAIKNRKKHIIFINFTQTSLLNFINKDYIYHLNTHSQLESPLQIALF